MATYTDSFGFAKGQASISPPAFNRQQREGLIEVVLDFAKIKAARAAAGVAALAAADILEVMPIPANTRVEQVGYQIITPEGATFTFDVGDGSSQTGYFNNADGNAAAGTVGVTTLVLTEGTPNTITGYAMGKTYTSADTIDMTIDHNSVDVAVIRLWAKTFYLGVL